MLIALILLSALAALVIFINWESWPWRIGWAVILAVALFFLPGSYKLLGPIVLIILLSTLQTIHNKRHPVEDDDWD